MAGQIKNKISSLSVSEGSLSTELNKPYERRTSPMIGTIKDIPGEGLVLVEWNQDQEAKNMDTIKSMYTNIFFTVRKKK